MAHFILRNIISFIIISCIIILYERFILKNHHFMLKNRHLSIRIIVVMLSWLDQVFYAFLA